MTRQLLSNPACEVSPESTRHMPPHISTPALRRWRSFHPCLLAQVDESLAIYRKPVHRDLTWRATSPSPAWLIDESSQRSGKRTSRGYSWIQAKTSLLLRPQRRACFHRAPPHRVIIHPRASMSYRYPSRFPSSIKHQAFILRRAHNLSSSRSTSTKTEDRTLLTQPSPPSPPPSFAP